MYPSAGAWGGRGGTGSAAASMICMVAPALVKLEYTDLIEGRDLSDAIEQAFGNEGLGLLTVAGVPGLERMRSSLLPLAGRFAALPDPIKALYEHKSSKYQFGWSHGKEALRSGDPDMSKGSYYNNPLGNSPFSEDDGGPLTFTHPNIWPREHIPALEPAFMALGSAMVDVGVLVAKQCDTYVEARCPTFQAGTLARLIQASRMCKGRLLHYFPLTKEQAARVHGDVALQTASWCGWHLDHGSLTALVAPLFLDSNGREVDVNTEGSGLYVCTRAGDVVEVSYSANELAFQIGETSQILTGGLLQATPHAVRGSALTGVSRETFAVFMEPEYDYCLSVPAGVNAGCVQSSRSEGALPAGVPKLADRWGTERCPHECTFGQFTEATLEAFH